MLFFSLPVFKDSAGTEKVQVSLHQVPNSTFGLLMSDLLNQLILYPSSQVGLLFSWRTDFIILSVL